MNTNSILASLGKVGELFYQTMIGKLNAGNYPPGDSTRNPPLSSIQDATSVDSPKSDGGKHFIEIKIDGRKAPYALAYEKGSGIHKEGGGSAYPILPRNSQKMTFPEGDWPQWEDWGGKGAVPWKGLFTLTKVMHPGVEAKPYIKPTITEINDEVKKILAADFKTEFLKGGKPVEVIK